MKQSDEILAAIRNELPIVKRRYGVRHLVVFGSVARSVERRVGDVDILVDFDGPATFDRYMGLKFHLEDVLGLRVDLVTKKAIRPEIAQNIEDDAVHVA